MRWFILSLLAMATVMAQESFEYTTGRNVIRYQVPSALMGPPIATVRNTHRTSDDLRVFVTGYMSSGLFKDTALGGLNISMIEWPENCPLWNDVVKRLQVHLSVPGIDVTSEDQSWHGLPWKIFEQRQAKNGTWVGMSCYVPLVGKEILYVGLVIHDGVKIPQSRRDAFRSAVYQLLGSISVRSEGQNAESRAASKQSDTNSLFGRGS